MRIPGLLLLGLAVSGCCHSQYSHDPRAAVVGPAYLEYMADYPRDCATEYYYPTFHLRDFPGLPLEPVPITISSSVDALLIERPPETSHVKSETGKGYPDLEAKGIRLFTRSN